VILDIMMPGMDGIEDLQAHSQQHADRRRPDRDVQAHSRATTTSSVLAWRARIT